MKYPACIEGPAIGSFVAWSAGLMRLLYAVLQGSELNKIGFSSLTMMLLQVGDHFLLQNVICRAVLNNFNVAFVGKIDISNFDEN
jgi:hypothetical protein